MKNLGIKLFSLAIALGLSYYVNSETNISVIGFSAPVEIRNIPDDKILVWPLSPKVQVTLRGPSYLVSQVATSNVTYKLMLPNVVTDSFQTELLTTGLAIPASVEVVAIEPAQLEFTFDNKVKKDLPVVVPRYGNLSDDVKIVAMEVRPPTVSIIGPETALNNINGIETEPVDYRGLRSDLTKRLALRHPGNLITVSNDFVDLKIQVETTDLSRTLTSIPIEIRATNGSNYSITPSVVSLDLTGPASLISLLESKDIIPYVRLDNTNKKGDKITVEVDTPAQINVVQTTPSVVVISAVTESSNKN